MLNNWPLYSILLIIILLCLGFLWFEKRETSAKEIALIANLAALAGLSRVPFAVVPSLQPTTFLVLISGFVFGPVSGFIVGTLAALVSNIFLGQGPWTPLQMIAWGLAGICGGVAGKRSWKRFPKIGMVLLAFCWGFLFGWILNTWHWLAFVYPLTFRSFMLTHITSFWADLMHSFGNALFMYFAGEDLVKLLYRFKRRLVTKYLSQEKKKL